MQEVIDYFRGFVSNKSRLRLVLFIYKQVYNTWKIQKKEKRR